jgi:hypothetical protein
VTPDDHRPVSDSRRRISIALVSAALVLLQVLITRIVSVLLWYHWAFLGRLRPA